MARGRRRVCYRLLLRGCSRGSRWRRRTRLNGGRTRRDARRPRLRYGGWLRCLRARRSWPRFTGVAHAHQRHRSAVRALPSRASATVVPTERSRPRIGAAVKAQSSCAISPAAEQDKAHSVLTVSKPPRASAFRPRESRWVYQWKGSLSPSLRRLLARRARRRAPRALGAVLVFIARRRRGLRDPHAGSGMRATSSPSTTCISRRWPRAPS